MEKSNKELLQLLLQEFVGRYDNKKYCYIDGKMVLGICVTIPSLYKINSDNEQKRLKDILDIELPPRLYGVNCRTYSFPLTIEGYYQRIGFLQTLIEKY